MASIFARHYAPSRWNPQMPSGPCPGLTLREWEVGVLLCSLPPTIKQALFTWLITPTDPNWPRPDDFSRQAQPLTASDLRSQTHPLPTRLFEEAQAIRQTLDKSLEDLYGLARDFLLVARGTRLRQVVEALGEARALQEIEAMRRVTCWAQARPRPTGFFSTRWGGRWAGYFASAGN
jgi:hypothetical protein